MTNDFGVEVVFVRGRGDKSASMAVERYPAAAVALKGVVAARNATAVGQLHPKVFADGPAMKGGEHGAHVTVVGCGAGKVWRYGMDNSAELLADGHGSSMGCC